MWLYPYYLVPVIACSVAAGASCTSSSSSGETHPRADRDPESHQAWRSRGGKAGRGHAGNGRGEEAAGTAVPVAGDPPNTLGIKH
jgi:hypothetical protein